MKRNYIGSLSLAVFSLLLTTTGAFAQSIVEADVPFAFKAGVTQLPPGHYQIKEDHVREFITIRNVVTAAIVVASVQQNTPSDAGSRLVFHHFGDQYFLAEIRGGMNSLDMTLPVTKQERQLQSLQVASGPSKASQQVEIALK